VAAAYIGTSGWSYDQWQGILYPERTPSAKRLAYYVQRFTTVEANNTFYYWPRDSTFEEWCDQLPDDVVFTVKAPRALTHYSHL